MKARARNLPRRWLPQLHLRTRITGMVLVITLATALCLSLLGYRQARDRAQSHAVAELTSAAWLYAERLAQGFSLMRGDAESLRSFPAIAAFARRTPGTSDQASAPASTFPAPPPQPATDAATERLQQIFASIIAGREGYSQIRLIGRADNWREVVRINRMPDGIVRVPASELQSKGDEPYLAPLKAAGAGPFPAYFSSITLNREHGRVDGPPTIRFVQPVLDQDGGLFGAIVINADYESALASSEPLVAPGYEVLVVDSTLDHMSFTARGPRALRRQGDPDWHAPPLAAELATGKAVEGWFERDDLGIYAVPVSRLVDGPPLGLHVLTIVPKAVLLRPVRRELAGSLLTGLGLSGLAAAASFLLSTALMRPLTQLTQQLGQTTRPERVPELDITARDEVGELARAFARLSEALIRESERSDAILSRAADAIITIDRQGRIETANSAAIRMFGHPARELLSAPVARLMPEAFARSHQQFVDNASTDQTPRPMSSGREIFGLRADGSTIPLEISISCASYGGADHFVGVVRDISARKAEEARNAALVAALERSNAELDQFAYVASHDLKAPLRVIDNASRWLAEDLGPLLTEDTRESLDLLRNRVGRMERLLDDLLQHSRIGRVDSPSTVVRGDLLLQEVAELVALPEGFRLEVSPAFRDSLLQRMPLQTVLLNLISNAVKHHDRTEGHIHVELGEAGDMLEISVSDDGPGIPPAYHERIFEMFQTLKPRDQMESSGMGLAMVRKFVRLAGGRIEVASDGGRGTTFRLFWPRLTEGSQEGAA